jgi:hypothetical protein
VDSTHTGREGERNPKEGARYLRITSRWKEGKTLKRRISSREDVSVINEIGEANGAWNTVQVAIMANTRTGGANPIGSYSGG